MKRKQIHDCTHLTLDERKIIQTGIENESTKADIARTLGKDATTIVFRAISFCRYMLHISVRLNCDNYALLYIALLSKKFFHKKSFVKPEPKARSLRFDKMILMKYNLAYKAYIYKMHGCNVLYF